MSLSFETCFLKLYCLCQCTTRVSQHEHETHVQCFFSQFEIIPSNSLQNDTDFFLPICEFKFPPHSTYFSIELSHIEITSRQRTIEMKYSVFKSRDIFLLFCYSELSGVQFLDCEPNWPYKTGVTPCTMISSSSSSIFTTSTSSTHHPCLVHTAPCHSPACSHSRSCVQFSWLCVSHLCLSSSLQVSWQTGSDQ